MSVLETTSIFAGIPLAVIGLFAAIIFGFSAKREARYRPGMPYEFTPVWFLAPDDRPGEQIATSLLTAGELSQGGARDTW